MEVNNYDYIADLYDIYVPATFDVEFFIKETKESSGEVLELMSGTGRVSIPLLKEGIDLTCVDNSEKSNDILNHKLQQVGLIADIYQMDICELKIPKKYDMVIIPFHSFAHVVSTADQRKVFDLIFHHLLPGGTFICTLGNPSIRQQSVDGQLRLFRKYPLPQNQGTLLLWISEDNDPVDNQIVRAIQFFEEYDQQGIMTSKRLLELHFRLSQKNDIEAMAEAAGFCIKAFYGDYDYSDFSSESSPFMIWKFGKPT